MQERNWKELTIFISQEQLGNLREEAQQRGMTVEKYCRIKLRNQENKDSPENLAINQVSRQITRSLFDMCETAGMDKQAFLKELKSGIKEKHITNLDSDSEIVLEIEKMAEPSEDLSYSSVMEGLRGVN